MSHNVTISGVKITNLDALRAAVEELAGAGHKISMHSNGTFRTWPGQPNKSDFTIALGSEKHDIGLVKQPDGSYNPVFDPYNMSRGGEGISCSINRNDNSDARGPIAKLLQLYSVNLTEREMALQGHSCQRITDAETGVISIVAETV